MANPVVKVKQISRGGSGLSWRLVRLEGRDPATVEFEERVVDFFLNAAAVLGVPKSLAAIYGVCFASAEPLSFSDVAARLNISSGSVSQGLRVLKDVGALKIVRAGLDRREHFTPDLGLRRLVAHYIETRVQRQLDDGQARLEAIHKALPARSQEEGEILRARLESLQGWHGQTRLLLPLIRSFLRLTS